MTSKVVLYTTAYCPYCRAAKELLRSKKITFEEVDVEKNDTLRAKLVAMSGQETVPQIFVDGKSIGGYTELVQFFREGKSF